MTTGLCEATTAEVSTAANSSPEAANSPLRITSTLSLSPRSWTANSKSASPLWFSSSKVPQIRLAQVRISLHSSRAPTSHISVKGYRRWISHRRSQFRLACIRLFPSRHQRKITSLCQSLTTTRAILSSLIEMWLRNKSSRRQLLWQSKALIQWLVLWSQSTKINSFDIG